MSTTYDGSVSNAETARSMSGPNRTSSSSDVSSTCDASYEMRRLRVELTLSSAVPSFRSLRALRSKLRLPSILRRDWT